MVGLPLIGKEGSVALVFKILVRALTTVILPAAKLELHNM